MFAARPRATHRLTLIAAFAASLLAAVASPRAASPGEMLLTEWADALRVGGADVRWASLIEGDDDRLTLSDVEIRLAAGAPDGARITVPTLTFHGLARRSGGGFSARTVRMPGLEATGRSGKETVSITLADAELSDIAVPRLVVPPLDPDHPLASTIDRSRMFDGVALGRLSVARTVVTGREKARTDASFTLSDVTLGGLAGGRFERFRLGSLAFDGTTDGRRARFSVDALEIDGWDPGAWFHIFDDRAYVDGRGDGLWRPYLAAARTGRVALDASEATVAFDRFTSGSRSVRPFPEPLGGVIERILREPEAVAPADGLRLVLELYLATRHDGWSIEGLRITGPELDHLEIGRFAFGAFAPEGLAQFAIERLDAVAAKAILRLGRFALTDLRLPDPDDLRRAVPAVLAGAEIDPSSLAPTLGGVAVEGLEVTEPGVPAIRLGLFRLDLARHLRAVPTIVALTIDHFVVPAGLADSEGRATLAGLGYDRVDISLGGRLEWLEAKREVVLEGGRIAVADAGEAAVTARLIGVPRSLFLRPETLPLALGGVGLAEATATLTDASFVDRLIRLLAKDERMKPEKLRRRLADEAAAEMRAIRDPARRKAFAAAVRAFVLKPTAITFAARPKRPIALPELLALGDDLVPAAEKLELSVTTAE